MKKNTAVISKFDKNPANLTNASLETAYGSPSPFLKIQKVQNTKFPSGDGTQNLTCRLLFSIIDIFKMVHFHSSVLSLFVIYLLSTIDCLVRDKFYSLEVAVL